MNDEPRAHLYLFTHRVLPGLGLNHVKEMIGALCGPKHPEFFMALWNDIANGLEPANRMPLPALKCTNHRRDRHIFALIHYPRPAGITEPHFSAFVFGPIEEHALDRIPARYFVLEHGVSIETGAPRTVLGEWTKESHLNHGDGPAPVAELFEDAVWKAAGVDSAG